jgi:hypothetical protein
MAKISKKGYVENIQYRIDYWLEEVPPESKWMTVNNSSVHMSVFPEFHSNIEEIHRNLKHEKAEPLAYSTTSVVWDIQENRPIYVWHELNELPASTSDDIQLLDEEIEHNRREREERERKIHEEREQRERIDKLTHERKTTLENKYNLYVKDCVEQEVQPIPFYEYEQ